MRRSYFLCSVKKHSDWPIKKGLWEFPFTRSQIDVTAIAKGQTRWSTCGAIFCLEIILIVLGKLTLCLSFLGLSFSFMQANADLEQWSMYRIVSRNFHLKVNLTSNSDLFLCFVKTLNKKTSIYLFCFFFNNDRNMETCNQQEGCIVSGVIGS